MDTIEAAKRLDAPASRSTFLKKGYLVLAGLGMSAAVGQLFSIETLSTPLLHGLATAGFAIGRFVHLIGGVFA
jgi:hypothetical protein